MSKKNTNKNTDKNTDTIKNINNIKFLLVEKSGNIKEVIFNNFDINELYKKCGFRKPDNFICRNVWENIKIGKNIHNIEIWSRNDGKANTENKYDFPPPIDKDLYFGNCAILEINKEKNNYKNLTKEIWNKIYETLFGNFENLNDTYENDEDEIDELLNINKELKTKGIGYLKDGFVVDSDDEEDNVSNSNEDDQTTDEETDISTIELSDDIDEEQEDEIKDNLNNKKKIIKPKNNKKNSKQKSIVNENINVLNKSNIFINNINQKNINNEELFLDDITNGSELTFEDYDYVSEYDIDYDSVSG